MMKFDYNIVWLQEAEIKLFYQADYILQQSQNPIIAEQFYDAIKVKWINFPLLPMFIDFARKRNSHFKR